MGLMHNQLFRLLPDSSPGAYPAGIYRVVFDDPASEKTACVCIEYAELPKVDRGGRKRSKRTKNVRRKPPAKLIGNIVWMERSELIRLSEAKLLIVIEIEREVIYFSPPKTPKDQKEYRRRCKAMASFLDLKKLKEGVLEHHGLSGLAREAMVEAGVCRSYVYKQWSTLCRLGFTEISLLPRRDRCGAPKVARPCDPNGRKKAGAKTKEQQIAQAHGVTLPPKQPGMSTDWRERILAADGTIKTAVKPAMPQRITLITASAFVRRYRYDGEAIVPIPPSEGEYPNRQQIRRVLETDKSRLERLRAQTTVGHFERSLRGLTARNWKGVAGPGHTWAVDSTLADIYLRSSINRAWIVGRPIVYIVADIWSTAIVGFYVCLTGPSWNTAKISLFNSVADPNLLGDIWGYQPLISLNPIASLCYQLMCDRGEYLSKRASLTALQLRLHMGYAPPYRPDLKGLVEVLHRVKKDIQYLFIPGAMNFRRAEFDLRKSHPDESAFTVSEYTQYLHFIFNNYNLTADRSKRVDAHMAAAGVMPSPAGLWRWGHEMGIGFQRAMPQADLITTLLNSDTARVGRSSVIFAGNDYQSDVVKAEQWTALARNFGSWEIPIHYYPGPVGRIWTPNTNGEGLLELQISAQANTSAEVTFDELGDSIAYRQLQRAEVEHKKNLHAWESLHRVQALRENALRLTGEAIANARGEKPTMTEARLIEVAGATPHRSEAKVTEELRDEVMDAHQAMMSSFLKSANPVEGDHE